MSAKTASAKKPGRPPGSTKKPARRSIGRPAAEGGVGRESLIETTCELLRVLPPNEVTRIGVARQANVDPSLIKYYFRDRSSLLLAAAERLMDKAAVAMEAASAQAGDTAEGRLKARIRGLLDLNLDYPFFHRLMVDEVVNAHEPSARKLLRATIERRRSIYGEIIELGTQEGTLRPVDAFFLSTSIIGMCEFFATGMGIVREAFGGDLDEAAQRERYKEFVTDLVLNGLRVRGAAPAKAAKKTPAKKPAAKKPVAKKAKSKAD